MRDRKNKYQLVGVMLLLIVPLMANASNKKNVEKKMYEESMMIVAYFFPDSHICISDSLYRFSGNEFTHLVDNNTIRNIKEFEDNPSLCAMRPVYSRTLRSLAKTYSKKDCGSTAYLVRFSMPYKGMMSCEVSPRCRSHGGKETHFLFRFSQVSGKVYNTTRLTVETEERE